MAEPTNSENDTSTNWSSFSSTSYYWHPVSPPSPSSSSGSGSGSKKAVAVKPESTEKDQKRPAKRARDNSRHPVYGGVRMRTWGKWVSEIREPRKKNEGTETSGRVRRKTKNFRWVRRKMETKVKWVKRRKSPNAIVLCVSSGREREFWESERVLGVFTLSEI